jgi:hypothetical protein
MLSCHCNKVTVLLEELDSLIDALMSAVVRVLFS